MCEDMVFEEDGRLVCSAHFRDDELRAGSQAKGSKASSTKTYWGSRCIKAEANASGELRKSIDQKMQSVLPEGEDRYKDAYDSVRAWQQTTFKDMAFNNDASNPTDIALVSAKSGCGKTTSDGRWAALHSSPHEHCSHSTISKPC